MVVNTLAVDYQRLWDQLYFAKVNKSEFADQCGFLRNTLDKMGRNEYVNLSTINKICQKLNCKIEDVVEVTPDITITRNEIEEEKM